MTLEQKMKSTQNASNSELEQEAFVNSLSWNRHTFDHAAYLPDDAAGDLGTNAESGTTYDPFTTARARDVDADATRSRFHTPGKSQPFQLRLQDLDGGHRLVLGRPSHGMSRMIDSAWLQASRTVARLVRDVSKHASEVEARRHTNGRAGY